MPLNLSSFDAAIVDLDGTLIDTLGDFTAAIDAMLVELGLPPIAPGRVRDFIGKGSEHLIDSVLRAVREPGEGPPPATLVRDAWEHYQRHYGIVNGRAATVYPGAAEGLAALRARGLRLACLTNKPGAFAAALLQDKGLAGYFEHVFGGDAFSAKKPDPLPVRKTCEALGSAPQRTLVIGDSRNDAQAARAAGCAVLLVRYGYNHGEDVALVDTDGLLDSMAELADFGEPPELAEQSGRAEQDARARAGDSASLAKPALRPARA